MDHFKVCIKINVNSAVLNISNEKKSLSHNNNNNSMKIKPEINKKSFFFIPHRTAPSHLGTCIYMMNNSPAKRSSARSNLTLPHYFSCGSALLQNSL